MHALLPAKEHSKQAVNGMLELRTELTAYIYICEKLKRGKARCN